MGVAPCVVKNPPGGGSFHKEFWGVGQAWAFGVPVGSGQMLGLLPQQELEQGQPLVRRNQTVVALQQAAQASPLRPVPPAAPEQSLVGLVQNVSIYSPEYRPLRSPSHTDGQYSQISLPAAPFGRG